MALNTVEVMLLGALIKIRDEGPDEQCYGICWHVEEHAGWRAKAEFQEVSKHWPKYSGNEWYPIPGYGDLDEIESYKEARAKGTTWDSSTGYGQLRYELLNFCIDYLTQKEKE